MNYDDDVIKTIKFGDSVNFYFYFYYTLGLVIGQLDDFLSYKIIDFSA
jgi:hypothetical protein